ncbi:hypothetical protein ACIBEF_00385 [Micromonospora sp. NPDC050795]|uniref:hypothetical protein n=1 Tax=Micromonospora sp. NPDC050795 TaxID=3364282 RepID=UPI00379C2DA8
MITFRRAPVDPELEAARAAAQREQARFDLERTRLEAQLAREQQEAHAEFTRRQAIADEQEKRRRDTILRAEKAERRDRNRKARAEFMAKLRPVLPLLLINGGAAYAQAAYAFEEIAPAYWNTPSKVAFAVAFSAALESIAVYVQWHAHDALMLRAHATAASLRRASWGIAAVVGAINYAHFADGMQPTAAAVAFALLSLLSPWLWGLHTRRAQHVQLLAEDANLIDEGGVEFSPQRRRAFPWRSWQAKRWSIDHGERDPRAAWEGYNEERRARKAERQLRRHEKAVDREAEKTAIAPAPEPPADDLAVIVDAITEPTPTAEVPAAHRPRWRPNVTRRPRRMGRPQPQIIVNLPEPKPARRPAEPTAKTSTSAGSRGRPSSAQKVANFAAKNPGLTVAEMAKKLNLSADTISRHLPKQTASVNGHNLSN